jgi:hypothetical protein
METEEDNNQTGAEKDDQPRGLDSVLDIDVLNHGEVLSDSASDGDRV